MPADVPENFGGFKSLRPPLASGELLPVWEPSSPAFAEWRKTNVRAAKAEGLFDRHRDHAAGQLDGRSDARAGRHCRSGGRRVPALLDDPECDLRLGAGWRAEACLRGASETQSGGRRRGRNHRRHHVSRRLQLQFGTHQDHGLGRRAAKRAREADRSRDPQAAHQRERLPEFLRPALGGRYRFLRQRAQDRRSRRR